MSFCFTESCSPTWTEAERLAALRSFEILDTDSEAFFDELAKVAARICDAPIVLISLMDEHRQWFKSEIGFGMREAAREIAICAHTILQSSVFVVPDTTKDPRFSTNPMVTGAPHIRFYAGAPLITDEGLPIGTLCVLDRQPRPMGVTQGQSETLVALASAVMSQLKLRGVNKALEESRTRLATTIDSVPQMVWSAQPDGHNDFHNRRWYEFTGVPQGSPDGEKWDEFIHPEDQDRARSAWRQSLATGQACEVEYRLRHHSGEYRWTLGRAVPLRNEKGEVERWFGTCTEIHGAKRMEAALAESEERNRALVEASSAMVWRASPDGSILNGWGWEEFCGQLPEEYEGNGWLAAVHPEDRDYVVTTWQELLENGQPGAVEYRVLTKDGTYQWVNARGVPLKAEDGSVREWVGTITDIHEQKTTAEKLRTNEERYRALIEASTTMVWRATPDGLIIDVSSGWRDVSGQEAEAFRGFGWLEVLHPDDRDRVITHWQEVRASRRSGTNEFRVRHVSGEYRWFATKTVPLLNANGDVQEWVGTITDIHDRKQAEEKLRASEERLRLALQAGRMAALEMDLATNLITRHQNTVDLLGIESSVLSDFMTHVHPADQHKRETFFSEIERQGSSSIEFRYTLPSGQTHWFGLRAEKSAPDQLVGVIFDISDRKAAEEELWRLANHDPLTGLPNRSLFQHRFERAIDEAKRKGTPVNLLLIDLDSFKDVNDSFGHDAGDALLMETAARLTAATRDSDTVARLGGDEFAILITGAPKLENAAFLAENLPRKLSQPFSYAGQTVASTASVGVAVFPNHDTEPAELMKDADIALYRAKAEGRNRVVSYSPDMRTATEQRIILRKEMREAILRDQIAPYYQPKVCLSTGTIVGFEALARWEHPTRGLLTPSTFGAAFDDPDLVARLGKRLIGKIASDMRRWLNAGIQFGQVAINLSHAEFVQPGLAEDILRIIELAKIPPRYLEIEITEKVLLEARIDAVTSALETFRQRGVKIALDDFGTGYASLTHLKQFPVDHIKVDRSFVSDIEHDPDDEAIVMAVVSLGRSLHLQVTAEGVETMGQAQRLREMGCGHAQGYLFAKPLAAWEVPQVLSEWSARLIPARRLVLVDR